MTNPRPTPRRPRPPRAHPPPSPPPQTLVLLAHLASTLPLWFNSAATDLVTPLYSHQPSHALRPTLAFYTACALGFLALAGARKGRPHVGWREAWFVMGAYKVVTEGVLRWGGGKLVTRAGSLDEGVVAARVALELVPTVATWAWLVGSSSCAERKVFLSSSFLPLAYLVSLAPPVTTFLRSRLPILPECCILQPHGLMLCALALLAPRTFLPPTRQPRARPHPLPCPSALDRLAPHPLARLALVALVALAAHRVAQSSAHCPTSPQGALPPGVLAARKSVTGWITVGEYEMALPGSSAGGAGGRGPDTTIRYLRADHSLLGGLWVGPSWDELRRVRRQDGRGGEPDEEEVVRRAESIYSTFILQELVRLVPAPVDLPRQSPEQGLIIGLGAGLSARALAQHGVNLTLVELDPAVYEFARDYFGVGADVEAGEVVLEDAVRWVERQEGDKLFDYIVHDVFTGGAVPTALFLLPFLTRLSALLHPSGVVALNFAGSLSPKSPASSSILRTVLSAFESTGGHCRAFEDVPRAHDAPPPPPSPNDADDEIRNVVVFCSRSWFVPIEFRAVERGDLLEYPSPGIRRSVFREFEGHEVDLEPFRVAQGDEERVLMRDEGDARRVEGEQLGEVGRHWEAMRGVLPVEVWARW
ncbi:hypothetical protein JCM8208_004959 [Rhodotorula glutinis]